MNTVVNLRTKYYVAPVDSFPEDGGVCALVGDHQIAIFRYAGDQYYACDNACPHTGSMVLARGLLADSGGQPRVVCPMHKKSFSLESGQCTSEDFAVQTYPVLVEGSSVYLLLPEEYLEASEK